MSLKTGGLPTGGLPTGGPQTGFLLTRCPNEGSHPIFRPGGPKTGGLQDYCRIRSKPNFAQLYHIIRGRVWAKAGLWSCYFINPTFLKMVLDFQLVSFVDSKPVELWESAIPLKYHWSLLVWSNRPLACCPVYFFSNCVDFSNFIFSIKQGSLKKTLEV